MPPAASCPPDRVCLVMNPALATNQNYLDKVTALVANFPDQQDEWASIQTATEDARRLNVSVSPISQALTRVKSAVERGRQSDATDYAGSKVLWWFQRWLVFVLVAFFIARRGWRYFHEVQEDDDFADHLATLAVGASLGFSGLSGAVDFGGRDRIFSIREFILFVVGSISGVFPPPVFLRG